MKCSDDSLSNNLNASLAPRVLPVPAFTFEHVVGAPFSIGERKSARSVWGVAIVIDVVDAIAEAFNAGLSACVQAVVTHWTAAETLRWRRAALIIGYHFTNAKQEIMWLDE